MNNRIKISAIGAMAFLSASVYSQSDSLGMPGDDLNLRAVLSIFKESSSVEDFEKKLNSAGTKVNNLDLNGDNQVDYLRVVDYGKDDFHSLVIQDPVSKTESQDVAVIEVLKKSDNTAHIQIVGDETLYGKDYIIEPENQAALKSSSDKSDLANDDVYESGNSSTHVMINVWGWPGVTYLYSPGYAYWVSPWYWDYYPLWYSPWRPYGWYVYHRGFYGYNYGFYGYRRHHYAFPHVHNHYYGRRVSSGYVRKTAPHYGHRRDGMNQGGSRVEQHRRSGNGDQRVNSNNQGKNNSRDRVRNNSRSGSNREQHQAQPNNGRGDRTKVNTNPGRSQDNQKKSEQRANPGAGGRSGGDNRQVNPGSGRRSGSGTRQVNPGGGGRQGNPSGGGGHRK